MTTVIEIEVPIEEIAAREERVTKTKRFETPDRVPVIPAINYRYLLPVIGIRFREYYNDPEAMLRSQILGQKWLMENVKTDAYSVTGAWVGGWTDFQNATEASAMPQALSWMYVSTVPRHYHWMPKPPAPATASPSFSPAIFRPEIIPSRWLNPAALPSPTPIPASGT